MLIKFIGLLENYRTIEKLLVDLTVTLLNSVINVLKCAIGFIYDCEYSLIAESGSNNDMI